MGRGVLTISCGQSSKFMDTIKNDWHNYGQTLVEQLLWTQLNFHAIIRELTSTGLIIYYGPVQEQGMLRSHLRNSSCHNTAGTGCPGGEQPSRIDSLNRLIRLRTTSNNKEDTSPLYSHFYMQYVLHNLTSTRGSVGDWTVARKCAIWYQIANKYCGVRIVLAVVPGSSVDLEDVGCWSPLSPPPLLFSIDDCIDSQWMTNGQQQQQIALFGRS